MVIQRNVNGAQVTEAAPDPGTRSWPDAAFAWPDSTGTQLPVEEGRCFRPEQLAELTEMMLAHGYSRQWSGEFWARTSAGLCHGFLGLPRLKRRAACRQPTPSSETTIPYPPGALSML